MRIRSTVISASGTIELGVRTDDAPLAESIERELLDVEDCPYAGVIVE